MKIEKKVRGFIKRIHGAMFVVECPECGHICASGSEYSILKCMSWTTCDYCNLQINLN